MKRAPTGFCLFLSAEILLTLCTCSMAQDVSYFALNRSEPLTEDSSIKLLIRGERRNWEDGMPITVILPGKDAESYEHVAKNFFGGDGQLMQRHWLRMVFSGRSRAPIYAKTDAEIYKLASEIPGAFAVLKSTPPEGYPITIGTIP